MEYKKFTFEHKINKTRFSKEYNEQELYYGIGVFRKIAREIIDQLDNEGYKLISEETIIKSK